MATQLTKNISMSIKRTNNTTVVICLDATKEEEIKMPFWAKRMFARFKSHPFVSLTSIWHCPRMAGITFHMIDEEGADDLQSMMELET